MKIIVYGEPVPKARARVTKHGAYTPQKTKDAEAVIGYKCHGKKLEGEVRLLVDAYFKIPKKTSKANRELMVSGKIRPVKRPDWDNIGKLVSDAMNNIKYSDDSQFGS